MGPLGQTPKEVSLTEGTVAWGAVGECLVRYEDCKVGKRREKRTADECMHVNWIKEQEKGGRDTSSSHSDI